MISLGKVAYNMNVHGILLSKIITKIWEGIICFGEIFALCTPSLSICKFVHNVIR